MNLNDYQKKARQTAIYPRQYSVIYPALGLAGESGEVAEKIKKEIRDGCKGESCEDMSCPGPFESKEFKDKVIKEMGDVLWYLASLAEDLGVKLETVAKVNLEKLAKRKEENKLQGNGDNR